MTRLLALAAALLLCAASSASGHIQPRPALVPFLYEDARIYVPVRIGGGKPRWFILDTGATGTIIDSAAAKDEGLRVGGSDVVRGAGSGESVQGRANAVSLRVGSVPMRVAEPRVMDLARLLGPTSGRAPAGIIGSQFFREHFVDIDFARHRMAIMPPGSDQRGRYLASVHLTFADWTPLTHVRLSLPDGGSVLANSLVDLGAKSTFLIPEPFIDREKLRDRMPRTVVTGFGAGVGGDTFYAFARAKQLSLAAAPTIKLDDPVVGLSVGGTLRSDWHDGLLGAEFLSRFRVGFDYARHRLLLSPASAAPVRFDGSGLFLVASGDELRKILVRQVIAGSPADIAGISAGDEIVAINGTAVAALGLTGARDLLKVPRQRSIVLSIKRDEKIRDVRLALRELL